MKSKSQASLEYMTMIALSLVIFLGVLYVATTMMTTSSIQISVDTAYRAVQGIKEGADFIYVHGHPSKIQSNIRIPSNVENISIHDQVIRMRLSLGDAYTDVYAVAKGNLNSSVESNICTTEACSEGNYIFVFNSMDPATGYDVSITRL
ncbi:MAG TPA: hypothetical protein EYP86_01445 [Candidatus Altiarchaeales archaeon]|nr:hypothetical protein [Candidatus Altiarchaeales archaeon]